MNPLMRAPSVIPQLILNLCTVSIATCNKIFNQMTPFNGDRIRPRVTARAGGKMFSWLFDTGAAFTLHFLCDLRIDTTRESVCPNKALMLSRFV